MNNLKQYGFTVNRVKQLPELSAELYQMTHDKTGLELVWLKRDEENKTFGIAFETLPWDDTGVFHILEHSVLCGSDKYPVKEPFVELMKSSMNTFLNALTFPDKTFYPISSRNDKDFINLMRVYLDAVFCPLIYSKPEIFYQEGWHYELDENGDISYKGVVFNEMKGAFASADELAVNSLNRELFPDSPYRFVSGGDPAAIPDLTYEKFIDSHRRFYAPSNAYIFLDGSIDIEKTLAIINDEYLCRYERSERIAPPAIQKPVCGEAEGFYELAEGEALEGKVRLSFGKVIGTFEERERFVAAQVLSEVLCGSNQSPLTRAVLNEGLAEKVTMSVNDGVLQPWLMLDVKNLHEKDIERVQTVITAQLKLLAENGLDHEQLEAVMANAEFKMRERDYGYYPQGIIFGFSALETWLYGGDPAANLEVGELFVRLKEKMQEGYFEQLIRELLLDNPHSARVVLYPSYTAGEERRKKEQARIDREAAAWSAEQRSLIEAEQERLISWQESYDTPEAIATVPQLSIEDIPTQPERIPTEITEIAGIPVIMHELHTGGIAYINLYFDADCCSTEELSCLSLACSLLGESDTTEHSAETVINTTRKLCGNFDIYPSAYVVDGDLKNVSVKLCVSFSTLEADIQKALAHVAEVLTKSRFDDETAHDILRQIKMDVFQRTVMSGNSVGLGRITAQLSAAGVADDSIEGVSYYQWLKATDENWNFDALNAKMNMLIGKLINKRCMTIGVGGIEQKTIEALVTRAAQLIPNGDVQPKVEIKPWGKRREGIVIPADIAFAVLGGDINENGGKYCGGMQLATQIISLGYLWNVIRVQGGAYGTGMISRINGFTACYSYRDPNGAESVNCYRDCAAFLREFVQAGEDLTGFIIGAVSNASPLMTPRTKTRVGDEHYLSHVTWEERCERRKQLLSATAQDMLAIADVLEKTLNDGGICFVGGREQIDKCKELDNIITL